TANPVFLSNTVYVASPTRIIKMMNIGLSGFRSLPTSTGTIPLHPRSTTVEIVRLTNHREDLTALFAASQHLFLLSEHALRMVAGGRRSVLRAYRSLEGSEAICYPLPPWAPFVRFGSKAAAQVLAATPPTHLPAAPLAQSLSQSPP